MKVNDLLQDEKFSAVSLSDGEREIEGCYVGDLLSWVMGRATENQAWITIMSNMNIVAVASLVDVSCVILSEGVTLDEEIISVARQKEINIISTQLPTFEAAVELSKLN